MFWLKNKKIIFLIRSLSSRPEGGIKISSLFSLLCFFLLLGLIEIYVWFLLPTYPNFFNPTLNIKMVFGEKNI